LGVSRFCLVSGLETDAHGNGGGRQQQLLAVVIVDIDSDTASDYTCDHTKSKLSFSIPFSAVYFASLLLRY
jgi:hypothetical protein